MRWEEENKFGDENDYNYVDRKIDLSSGCQSGRAKNIMENMISEKISAENERKKIKEELKKKLENKDSVVNASANGTDENDREL